MIARTPNEFRRDANFLPVSFEKFWIQKFTKITLNRVGFIESGNERAVYRIAGGACCRASQSCRLGRTSRPSGKNKMRRAWLHTKFAFLTAWCRHSVGAF